MGKNCMERRGSRRTGGGSGGEGGSRRKNGRKPLIVSVRKATSSRPWSHEDWICLEETVKFLGGREAEEEEEEEKLIRGQ